MGTTMLVGILQKEDFRNNANSVEVGDRVILAIVVPSPPLDSSGTLTGELDGSVSAGAQIIENADASLDAGLTGSIAEEAEIHTQNSVSSASLDGELEGSISSDAAVYENAAVSLTSGLAGSIAADGAAIAPGVLEPTDFTAPEGRETVVLLSITVGESRKWWSVHGDESIGSLDSGSDVNVMDDQDITRISMGSRWWT